MHLGFVCNGFTRQQCFVYVAHNQLQVYRINELIASKDTGSVCFYPMNCSFSSHELFILVLWPIVCLREITAYYFCSTRSFCYFLYRSRLTRQKDCTISPIRFS